MNKKLEIDLADAATAYTMACSNLAHLVLKSGKTYVEMTDDEIRVVIRDIVISSHSEKEVHNRIKELGISSFLIQKLCPPKHLSSKKKFFATGAMTTKNGAMIVVTIT